MIASIQEELKDKYLKISTTYDNMSKEERKEAFMNYLLSSTHGQKLTTLISQIVACIANEEMYHESELITQELTMYVLLFISCSTFKLLYQCVLYTFYAMSGN